LLKIRPGGPRISPGNILLAIGFSGGIAGVIIDIGVDSGKARGGISKDIISPR